MTFRFNEAKTTEAAVLFLKKNNAAMNYMKLIKLLYLADRAALLSWGRPITGDSYVSMKKGPILSNVLDLINSGADPSHKSLWHQFISAPSKYNISLRKEPVFDELSKREKKAIEKVFEEYKGCNQWEMVDICHKNLPEWKDPGGSTFPIYIKDILRALKKTDKEIQQLEDEVRNMHFVDDVLSA